MQWSPQHLAWCRSLHPLFSKWKQPACKTPIPGIKLTSVTAVMEPRAKASKAAKPQHISLVFQTGGALLLTAWPRVAQLWSQSLLSFSEGASSQDNAWTGTRKENSKASTKWHLISFSGKPEQRSHGVTSFTMWLWECHYLHCTSPSVPSHRDLSFSHWWDKEVFEIHFVNEKLYI